MTAKQSIAGGCRRFLIDTLDARKHAFLENFRVVSKRPASDPVHDLRVAIRRLASILTLFDHLSQSRHSSETIESLKSLMSPLGDLRDTQVKMEWVGQFSEKCSEKPDDIVAVLKARETESMASIVESLKNYSVDAVKKISPTALMRPIDNRFRSSNFDLEMFCRMEVRSLLGKFARKLDEYRKTTKLSDLHRARIALKKFRYTLEIFLPFYPDLAPKELHSLQTRLGDINDLEVLIEWIDKLAKQAGVVNPKHAGELVAVAEAEMKKRLAKIEKGLIEHLNVVKNWEKKMKKDKGSKKKFDLEEARAEVMSMFQRFDPDPPHAKHVAKLSIDIAAGLQKVALVDFDARHRTLFEYGCLLHDIGWVEGRKGHHKSSYKMIVESELPIAAKDRRVIALVALFHRKAEPGDQQAFRELAKKDREPVSKMAAIIRVADLLDRSHSQQVRIKSIDLKENGVAITIPQNILTGLSEAAIEKKCAYFATVFGMPAQFIGSK